MFQGVPVTAQIQFWRHPDTKLCRGIIGGLTFFIFWLIVGVYIMWARGDIPSTPSGFLSYAAIYYIVYVLVIPVNWLVPCQRIGNLYLLAWFFNLCAGLLMSYQLAIIIYLLWTCYDGTQPIECRNLQLVELIFGGLTAGIWLLQLIIFILYTILLRGIWMLRGVRQIVAKHSSSSS